MLKKIGFFVILTSITFNLFSQESTDIVMDYMNPEEYEVAEITTSGIKFLDSDVLIHMTEIKVGDTILIPGEKITNAIEKLWNQGLFSDIEVNIKKIEKNKAYLNFSLQERRRLSKINFHGIRSSEEKDLLEKIELKPGRQITDNILSNTEHIIRSHYIEKGFFHNEVDFVQKDDTIRSNSIILDIHIDKKNKIKIKNVNFIGNEIFKNKKLRKALKKTKKKNFNIFKQSRYIPSQFKEDKKKLKEKYNEDGYRDFKILRDSIYQVSKKRISIDINITEGKQYFFRDIIWIGNTKYSTRLLNRILNIKKGDVYNEILLNNRLNVDEDAVSSIYMDNGYLFFNILPLEKVVENDSIDLEIRIQEGEQARIRKVIIKGNDKTNEHVIRREIRTKPGELFSKSDIIRTVRELAQLGYFDPENISPLPLPNYDDGTVDIEYSLVEKSTDQLELSGGWGAGMFIGSLGFRFSNFSIKNISNREAWKPLPSGDGQTLSLRAQTNGTYYQNYSMSFIEPWLGGKKPNALSISTNYSKQSNATSFGEKSDKYMKVFGASVGLGRRLKWPDDYFTLYTEVGIQSYNLNDFGSYFIFGTGKSNNLSFKIAFGRNSIDQPLYPRFGSTFELALQITPPFSLFKKDRWWEFSDAERETLESQLDLSGESGLTMNQAIYDLETSNKYNWIEYHKWTFKGEWYTQLAEKFVLTAKANLGILGYYNKDLRSPFESFDVGGSGMNFGYTNFLYGRDIIPLRGYKDGSVTAIHNQVKAGNIYDKFTMEIRYPLSLKPSATIYVLGFLEGGNSWYDFNEFNPFNIKRSAGFGVRIFLPILGQLGIDWGYGFDDIPGQPDASKGQLHFTMGQQL